MIEICLTSIPNPDCLGNLSETSRRNLSEIICNEELVWTTNHFVDREWTVLAAPQVSHHHHHLILLFWFVFVFVVVLVLRGCLWRGCWRLGSLRYWRH